MIQNILPQIKDASKRAGLIKHFAPKMEVAMNNLEHKIKQKEKLQENDGESEPLLNDSEKQKIEELAEQIAENKFKKSISKINVPKSPEEG